jgi:hypothetical protein
MTRAANLAEMALRGVFLPRCIDRMISNANQRAGTGRR